MRVVCSGGGGGEVRSTFFKLHLEPQNLNVNSR